MKLTSIVGARPQFIKLSPLCRAITRHNETDADDPIRSVIIHTGQHYDYEMSRSFFDQMLIPVPDHQLEVGSGSHGRQTGAMLEKIERVFEQDRPDIVAVFGDTNSTLAGALAACKLHIPVAHVEAGLRSFNKKMPEEINRILTDHMSTLLFCPTKNAVRNLSREGFQHMMTPDGINGDEASLDTVSPDHPLVLQCGDLMNDALVYNGAVAERHSSILSALSLTTRRYGLLTIHRAENTSSAPAFTRLTEYLAQSEDGMPLVFPVHPRTRHFIEENHIPMPANIRLIPPAHYFDMITLEKNAARIYTDSGGVQKEAYLFKVPCVTLREETEWLETVESGWNQLMDSAHPLPSLPTSLPPWDATLFGDGHAAEAHLRVLNEYCRSGKGTTM